MVVGGICSGVRSPGGGDLTDEDAPDQGIFNFTHFKMDLYYFSVPHWRTEVLHRDLLKVFLFKVFSSTHLISKFVFTHPALEHSKYITAFFFCAEQQVLFILVQSKLL